MTWTGNERVRTKASNGLTFWTRPALCDETVVDEVIGRDCYRIGTDPMLGQTVLDIGAHIGVFSALCLDLGATVISVEPQPENIELLKLNLEPFIGPRTLVYQSVGATEGPALLVGESGGAHIEPGHPDAVLIPQTTLAALLDETGPVDVLKLDIEGSEADVILACDQEHLALCHRIVMESHGPAMCPWLEKPRVGEIVEHLLYTHDVEVQGFPTHLGLLFATRNQAR